MSLSLIDKSISGMIWVFTDRFGTMGMNFVVNIILARLLTPADFGLVAMVIVLFELSNAFVNSGLATALIREKEVTQVDKSTVFFFNFIVSILLYILLYSCAPYIASFFNQPALTWIVRVMGLNVIIGAFTTIQSAILTREIHFQTQTKSRLLASFISGVIAVLMAFKGFGVWALVAKFGLTVLIDAIFLWVVSKWKPSPAFSFASFRHLFAFGSNILMTSLLERFFVHLYKLVIGKYFSATILGFYTQASNFKNLAVNSLFLTLQKVTYPVLSTLQNDLEKLKQGYRTIIRISSFVILPVMVVLGVLAQPIIVTLLGTKWLPAVPFLQLLCIGGVTQHISAANVNMLLVMGYSNLVLKLEVIKKIAIALSILIGIQYGIYGLVIGEVASTYLALLINTYYSKKFLSYSPADQFTDIANSLLFSVLSGLLAYLLVTSIGGSGFLKLIFYLIIVASCYLTLHIIAKTNEIELLRHIILPKVLRFFKT